MARLIRCEIAVGGLPAPIATLVLADVAGARGEDSLVPSFGEGYLRVLGTGFKVGERAAVAADIDGTE